MAVRLRSLFPALTVTSTAAAATTASLLRPGFIDGQGAPVNIFPIQHGNGLLTFQFGFHFYKRETPGLTRVPVGNDLGRGHCPGFRKKGVELFFGHVVS